MKRIVSGAILLCAMFLPGATALGATARQWQSGKLLDTEQQKVKQGSTTTYNTNGPGKRQKR